MYNKLTGLALLLLLHTGCSHNDLIVDKYAMSMAADVIYEKSRLNAVDAICGQPEYIACMDETDWKCKMELEPIRQPCYDKSVAKMGKPLVMDNYQEFISYYMVCLMTSHYLKQGSLSMQRADCVGDLKLDEDKLMSEIFK